jgi:lysyl-tRNA synthetase class 1
MNIKEISKIMKKDEGKLSFENVDLKDPVQVNELLMSINKLRNSIVSYSSTVTYSMVLNLISAIGVASSHLLLEYLRRYDPNVEKDRELFVVMILSAVRYFQDFIAPNKKYRPATEDERKWFADLRGRLAAYAGTDENELQAMVFDVAKAAGADARLVFKAIYEVLLGQERGPRFGTFAKLVGRERVAQLLDRALSP